MTDPLKDLEARAEKDAFQWVQAATSKTLVLTLADICAHAYIAGARAQHEITRKATIDEVLGLLRNGDVWAGFMGDPIIIDACANWLEAKLKVDLSKDPRETPL